MSQKCASIFITFEFPAFSVPSRISTTASKSKQKGRNHPQCANILVYAQRWRWLDDTSGFVSFVTIFRTIQFSKHCATECVRLTEAKIFFEIIQEVNRLFHVCQHRRNKFNPNNSGNILILYVNTVKDVNDLTDFYSAF